MIIPRSPQPTGAIPLASWTGLALLTAAYTVSFIDRTAVSVVQEDIKAELQLTDWQVGLMIGPAFAIVYSLAGLPLARLAEKGNRARLLAACISVWSVMAMACGLAGNFVTIFLARMGVGIGEAGGNPASHSLIADLFPEDRRATAIAIYTLGAPLGTFLGAAVVGWLAVAVGWRQTFLVLGLPGFFVAALIILWMHEPRRNVTANDGRAVPDSPPLFSSVVRELLQRSAFRHLVWGGSLVVLVGYCLAAFLPALLIRRYHLPLNQVGLITGLVTGLGGAIGTMAGGLAGDRWGGGHAPRLALITALAVFPAPFLLAAGVMSQELPLAVGGAFLGMVAIYGYVAPAFAQVHGMATTRTRATVTSIYYLITNLVGLGLGPPMLGAISDFWARRVMGLNADAFAKVCLAPGDRPAAACAEAMASGMEMALLAMTPLPLLAGVHFLVVARRHRQQAE